MKCECDRNCTCEVEQQKSIERDGKYYCSEACAGGHPGGQGWATRSAIAKLTFNGIRLQRTIYKSKGRYSQPAASDRNT